MTSNSNTIFVIDPPWPRKKGGIRSVRPLQGKELDYKTLSIQEIFELLDTRVLPKVNKSHVVFLWVIDKYLTVAEEQMISRGYRLHTRLIWNKLNGVAPAFTVRFTHEYVLWFYKPKFIPIANSYRGKMATVFEEKSREHSRKPDKFYQMVSSWYPNERKIDVFSREKRLDFFQFGDQPNFFTQPEKLDLSRSHL